MNFMPLESTLFWLVDPLESTLLGFDVAQPWLAGLWLVTLVVVACAAGLSHGCTRAIQPACYPLVPWVLQQKHIK
jgi:hypothetical protein